MPPFPPFKNEQKKTRREPCLLPPSKVRKHNKIFTKCKSNQKKNWRVPEKFPGKLASFLDFSEVFALGSSEPFFWLTIPPSAHVGWPKMVINFFGKRNFMQPMGRPKAHTECALHFFFLNLGGGIWRGIFFSFLWFPHLIFLKIDR
jgi:hypothetical protein